LGLFLALANYAGTQAQPAATNSYSELLDVGEAAPPMGGLGFTAPLPNLPQAAGDLPGGPVVQKAKLAPPAPAVERAIAPGRDLIPKVDDLARVGAILKLVEDVYNNKPLPYHEDGSIFKNKEKKLPVQPLGFYKEYTLLTGSAPHTVVIDGQAYQVAPDQSARGSERVIIGGGEKLYYTPDHYAHFIQLTVVR
jgi:guanyl-specific ribonuclease Sa